MQIFPFQENAPKHASLSSHITLLVGSETGTAEELASVLSLECFARGIICHTHLISSYDYSSLPAESTVVFVVSTCGQGEPPLMMKKFWEFLLRRDLPSDSLCSVKFGVFGLGDSSYPKILFRRLESLGASSMLPRGEGDDQNSLGQLGALQLWMETLWISLSSLGFRVFAHPCPLTRFSLSLSDAREHDRTVPRSIRYPEEFILVRSSRLTPADHFQSVVEYEFSSAVKYHAGDVFVLYPENSMEDVKFILELFSWDALASFELAILSAERPGMLLFASSAADGTVPEFYKTLLCLNHATLGFLLRKCLQISHLTPSMCVFKALAVLLRSQPDTNEVLGLWLEKLDELSSNAEEHSSYVSRPQRRLVEVLREISTSTGFSHFSIPVSCAFELFPWIKPRSFSISSSNTLFRSSFTITVALVEYAKRGIRGMRRGLCSAFLSDSVRPGDRVGGCIKKGSFSQTLRLAASANAPFLLLCAGTGIAPIRAIFQECPHVSKYLIFGYRYASKDALYLPELQASGTVISRGSRDDPARKTYIQDLILENRALVSSLVLQEKCYIFLCGSTHLAGPVRKVLQEIMPERQELLKELDSSRRFATETW